MGPDPFSHFCRKRDRSGSKGDNNKMSKKFTEIDEEFICHYCGKHVPALGYSCRNHCPYCLHSKHVDINPGDRQEECHGDLEPITVEIDGKKGYVIVDMDLIIKLTVHDQNGKL